MDERQLSTGLGIEGAQKNIAAGAGMSPRNLIDAPDRPLSVLQGTMQYMDRHNASIREASANVRDMIVNIRGPVAETADRGEKKDAAPPASDLGGLADSEQRLSNSINELHEAVNELRSILGY